MYIINPLLEVLSMEDNILVGSDDISIANKNRVFGNCFVLELKDNQLDVSNPEKKNNEIVFKLFGFIPIKKVVAQVCDDDFYIGGVPIGLDIRTKGVIVLDKGQSDFCDGDIITKVNDNEIVSVDDVAPALMKNDLTANVEFLRKNKKKSAIVKVSAIGRDLKLGVLAKDTISGIGTLTYVNKTTDEFGSLGHPLIESEGKNVVPVQCGDVVECEILGIEKSVCGKPGELKCSIFESANKKGVIENNTNFGVLGKIYDKNNLIDENQCAKICGKCAVCAGKAKLVSSIGGLREEYDIEIVKAKKQKSADDKSLVIRVTDKRLLNLTGGIVQGMSGSPIIQNGKLVGAVTHVFTSDPTMGYGVYIDWMLQ